MPSALDVTDAEHVAVDRLRIVGGPLKLGAMVVPGHCWCLCSEALGMAAIGGSLPAACHSMAGVLGQILTIWQPHASRVNPTAVGALLAELRAIEDGWPAGAPGNVSAQPAGGT